MADIQVEDSPHDFDALAPLRAVFAELTRRIDAGEDLGSTVLDWDALEPRQEDPEWDAWERAVLARTFNDE